jgi:hypothetical protein
MNRNMTVVLLLVLATGCISNPRDGAYAPPMDPTRKVSEQECTRPINDDGGNLLCRQVTEAERRARIAEEERQARARKEAAERAERERLERERAEQLAREEAARKQRAAEEERLAAEAAAAAAAERERRERAEAEARARQRAEQEAREAAARECRRLEQERSDGRALLANFVANYGKVEEFEGIAGQITAFLDKARKVKPCAPA